MTTESILVKTKDNNVFVFTVEYSNAAEKIRIKTACQNACGNKTYDELCGQRFNIQGASLDVENTEFLRQEIMGYHFRKEPAEYRNDLSTANKPPCPPNTIQFNYTTPDDSVPDVFKNIGGKIIARDRTFNVEFVDGAYEINDYTDTTALFYSDKNEIEVIRKQFCFKPEVYAEITAMINQFEAAKAADPSLDISVYAARTYTDDRKRSLFNIYANEYRRVQHHGKTVEHEIKHLKNKIFYDGLSIKDDARRLSTEDCYCIGVEDERSAYLAEVVQAVNEYLKGGKYDDFSMFGEFSGGFAHRLRKKSSDDERLAYATDYANIVRYALEKFQKSRRESYDESEFISSTEKLVEQQPATALEDTDRAWFKKIRSMYYNFEIYNPQTGRTEHKNLAQYITPELEVEAKNYKVKKQQQNADGSITEQEEIIDIESTIINPASKILQKKIEDISDKISKGEINTSLVNLAKALMRDNMQQSAFLDEIDNFRISSLYDNSNGWDPNMPPQPEIPSDHADWSDDLQKYWQQVDGYREIAKNNSEYKFAINDATVSYKNRHEVEVSDNAGYELYMKMLAEPTNKSRKVEFLDTLSEEQALTLYVACINSGRVPIGKVPTDLSKIDRLASIPEEARQTFRQRMGQQQSQQQTAKSQRQERGPSAQQLMAMRRYAGR